MAGGKESPRQKMIGMMYLVLTALLAMNVSKDILMAFVTVNESLERTNLSFTDNGNKIMKAFEIAKASNPKAAPYYVKAVEATKMADELFDHIEKLKHELIKITAKVPSGGDTMRLRYVDSKDDVNANTHELIGDDERNPKSGEFTAVELKNRIIALHDKLLKMVQDMQKNKSTEFLKDDYEALVKKIESLKPDAGDAFEDGNPVTWEILNFYHTPLAGVITNLSKIQSDVKIVEAEVISQFSGASGKVSVKFDQLCARVVAPSNYIQSGQPYKADVFIAASSKDFKDENMQVLVGAKYDSISKKLIDEGKAIPLVDGMGKLELTEGVGSHEFTGVIKFKKPTGEYDFYPFGSSYEVAAPSCAVQADKMNVFYIGVPNPITVSAAGIAPGNLVVSGTGGGISVKPSGAGKYIVTASTETTKGNEAKINVSAKTKDGTKPQGSGLFRVKRIPDPVAKVAGKKGGDIKKVEVQGIGAVAAVLEGFDFEANFIVQSFELTAIIKGVPYQASSTSPSLSQDMKSKLGGISVGGKIFFDEIKAKGPDGTIRRLSAIALRVR